jgi:GT2 family glycosyltransferase
MVESFGPRYSCIEEPAGGSYTARNEGVRCSKGEIYAFTDADCRPRPDWLENGVQALRRDSQIGLVGGRIEVVAGDAPSPFDLYDMIFGFPQETYTQKGFAATANMLTHADVMEEVGGFNEELVSGGDSRYGKDVSERGYTTRYAQRAIVEHPSRSSFGDHWAKAKRVQRGRLQADRLGLRVRSLFPPVWVWKDIVETSHLSFEEKMACCAAAMGVKYAYALARLKARLSSRERG